MRAERVFATSFECAPETPPSRRPSRTSVRLLRGRPLLWILGGVLVFLSVWTPGAFASGGTDVSAARAAASQPELSPEDSSGVALMPGQSVGPVARDLDGASFDGPIGDAVLQPAAVIPPLLLLHWLYFVRVAPLRPGLTSQLLVPG